MAWPPSCPGYQRSAVDQHQHCRFSDRDNFADEFVLSACEAEIRAIEMFATDLLRAAMAGFAAALNYANSDLALSGNHMFEGNFNGINIYDIEGGKKPATHLERDADLMALEKRLSDAIGLNVAVAAKKDGSGSVQIGYRTLEQLDTVLALLTGSH